MIIKASSLLLANGTLERAAWEMCGITRSALEWETGTGSEEEAGLREAMLGSPTLPWAAGNPRRCPWAAAGQAMRGQAAGHPSLCPALAEAAVGRAEGLEPQLRGKPLRPGSLQPLKDQHKHLSISSCLNNSCHLLLCFQTGQAGRTDPWGKSGCLQETRKGERGNLLPGEMRTCSRKWAPRNQLWSEEQPVSWTDQGTSHGVLCYSITVWSGRVKAYSTLKQKPSAGTNRRKTHILEREQPAPQEM